MVIRETIRFHAKTKVSRKDEKNIKNAKLYISFLTRLSMTCT